MRNGLKISFHNQRADQLPVEIVERKGKGHPDVICDRAAEELSIALCKYYLQRYGRIYHHNVDKCILVGGQSNPRFGGGEIVEPIYILLAGRAIGKVKDDVVPLKKIAIDCTWKWMRKEFRYLDPLTDVEIDCKVRPGSTGLVETVEEEIPISNDTSVGVSYAPMSELEKVVYGIEDKLNSRDVKRKFPAIGEDIKVMGVRRNGRIYITIACAMISSEVGDEKEYAEMKDAVRQISAEVASEICDRKVIVRVNTADNPRKKIYYLTVTGTSAEHGDDGEAGRGNRVNGLITPYRPMTMEAAAGKNPISHVGKLYSVAARRIAEELVEMGLEEVYCYMVSQIGKPITEPQVVNISAYTKKSEKEVEEMSRTVVRDVLEEIPDMWKSFLQRKFVIF